MPLHAKDAVRDELFDDIYCSRDSSVAVPKYQFPERSIPAEHALAIVHDELMLDGNARMNLATFCQTWVEPEVHRLMDECLDKNIVDKDEYPQTAEIEARSCTCWPICGIRRRRPTPSAARPPAPARRQCWRAWR